MVDNVYSRKLRGYSTTTVEASLEHGKDAYLATRASSLEALQIPSENRRGSVGLLCVLMAWRYSFEVAMCSPLVSGPGPFRDLTRPDGVDVIADSPATQGAEIIPPILGRGRHPLTSHLNPATDSPTLT